MRRTATKHVPMRRCVLCRTSLPQSELLRFTVVEDALRLDSKRRLGGRGTWVCRECAAERNQKRMRQAFRGRAEEAAELLRGELPGELPLGTKQQGSAAEATETNGAPRRIRVQQARQPDER